MIGIFGTLGIACSKKETLAAMCGAGMTGIRLNLSHAGLAESRLWIERYFAAARESGLDKAELILDTHGPELRLGQLAENLSLKEGDRVLLGSGGLPLPSAIFPEIKAGQSILLDDGRILLQAESCRAGQTEARVLRGGILKSRKSVALPGLEIKMPVLTGEDLANIALAPRYGVSGLMQSFVRGREDLLEIRRQLNLAGGEKIAIYAKIENQLGLEKLPELMDVADVIVIARGDLGNAMPLWELPRAQKEIAAMCKRAGKPFMVATQLLYTMEHAPVPTRAEISDIFNAVLDGASSLIVTGETAIGQFPVESIHYLSQTAGAAEEFMRYADNSEPV